MPFHPIALHLHLAVFIVNMVVVLALAITRISTSPNLSKDLENTRGQSFFHALDLVSSLTIILGLILTAVGIASGFIELFHAPETFPFEEFSIDMFMWIKIYLSFVFVCFYAVVLLFRFVYGKKLWKSKGMSLTYIIFIACGFFFMMITTFLGSYLTSFLLTGNPVELSEWVLEVLSATGIFVIFGASPGSIVANYTPGVVVEFSLITLLVTVVIIVDILLLSFVLFYGLRRRQIRSYNELFKGFKNKLQKGEIVKDDPHFQTLLYEMIALEIKQKD